MSNQNELNKINSLEVENNLLKQKIYELEQKIYELEQIIKSYKSRDHYNYSVSSSYPDIDVEINSPVFKSIPFVKRMNAFNYSNE